MVETEKTRGPVSTGLQLRLEFDMRLLRLPSGCREARLGRRRRAVEAVAVVIAAVAVAPRVAQIHPVRLSQPHSISPSLGVYLS